jgi:hypothetical protein
MKKEAEVFFLPECVGGPLDGDTLLARDIRQQRSGVVFVYRSRLTGGFVHRAYGEPVPANPDYWEFSGAYTSPSGPPVPDSPLEWTGYEPFVNAYGDPMDEMRF